MMLRVDRILWKGYPDSLRDPHDPSAFVLTGDGSGFLYYQGRPLERLMFQPIEPVGAARVPPRMVGSVAPYGCRPPRFSPAGDYVYFTALPEPDRLAPPRASFLRTHVVVASFPALEIQWLYPARGTAANTLAVFLDLHPSGRTVLIGSGQNVMAREASGPEMTLEVEELNLAGAPGQTPPSKVPLGFRIPAQAQISYSRDGRFIEFEVGGPWWKIAGSKSTRPTARERFDRTAGQRVPASSDQESPGVQVGDFDMKSFTAPHLGSFGWDGFPSHVLRNPSRPDSGCFPLHYSEEIVAASFTPPLPVSLRGAEVLLCAGPEDRPLPMVALWELRAPSSPWTVAVGQEGWGSLARKALCFDPRFLRGAVLARRPLEVEASILALARSLAPAAENEETSEARSDRAGPTDRSCTDQDQASADGAALEAVLAEEIVDPVAGSVSYRVRAIERSPGHLRVERVLATPVQPGGSDPQTDPDAPASLRPSREISAFDGEECWTWPGEGEILGLAPDQFVAIVNSYSPFRLLLDPARLGDPRLHIESIEPVEPDEPVGSGRPGEAGGKCLKRLRFFYDDGYRGELLVEECEGRMVPVQIRSRLFFETDAFRRALGEVPAYKTVSFEDWRRSAGRLVPHRILFEDGLTTRRLELQDLKWTAGARPDDFHRPEHGPR